MRKDIKDAIKTLKRKGYDELYLVHCVMTKDGEETDLWNIYDNRWQALNWVNLCYSWAVKNPSFKELGCSLYSFLMAVNRNEKKSSYAYIDGEGVVTNWYYRKVA